MANKNLSSGLLDPNVFGSPRTVDDVVAGALGPLGGESRFGDVEQQLADQLEQLRSVSQAQTETVQANTQSVNQNTTQLGQGGESTASKVGGALRDTLGLGLGLSPLITGLLGLFGGGGQTSEPAPPAPFALPPSIAVNAGVREAAPVQAPQITVQVQAMDSQSFLDHSHDIAMAVRQAMLQSTVLNDVIREV